jgi:hypothetical protein
MKLSKIIAVAALAIASTFCIAAAAMPASATTGMPPVIYNGGFGWNSPQVRPTWIYIGEGGSPIAHTSHWSTWNSKAGRSTGTLVTNNCIPDCALGSDSNHKLYVTLSGLEHHDGRAYYSVMTWYTPGYRLYGQRSSTMTMHYVRHGGTQPGWI